MPRPHRPHDEDEDRPRGPIHPAGLREPRGERRHWEVEGPEWEAYLRFFGGDQQMALVAARALDRGPDEQRVLAAMLIAVFEKLTALEELINNGRDSGPESVSA